MRMGEGEIRAFMRAVAGSGAAKAVPPSLYRAAAQVLSRSAAQRTGLEPADLVNELVARELDDRRKARRTADWSALSNAEASSWVRRRMRQLASEYADDRHLFRQTRAHVSAAIAHGLARGEIDAPSSLVHQGRLSAELVARAVASRDDAPALTPRDVTRVAVKIYREYLKKDAANDHELETLVDADAASPEERLEAKALAEAFLREIPADQHRAFGLRLADHGFSEIGRTVHAAISTVHARCASAEGTFVARARACEASPRAVRLALRHVASSALAA